jgi:catechol 2,3-dioxygenase-like lactoylglutathione lyase family enzyme
MRPRAPRSFEYVSLGVPDLARSTALFRDIVSLGVVSDDDERVRLRCGVEHHCVELEPAPGATRHEVRALGFSVESMSVLDDMRRRVEAAGLEVKPLREQIAPLTTAGFATTDPSGFRVELVYELQVWAEPPPLLHRPLDLVHPFLATPAYDESLEFYMGVLGFQASDYIAHQTAFLRCEDRYHHSVALRRTPGEASVDHLAFIMQSFDHMMRGHARARWSDMKITSGIVNHSASRSIAFYMSDPVLAPPIELCDGHVVLSPEEHETHVPRRMVADPRNIDVWRVTADDWGLR